MTTSKRPRSKSASSRAEGEVAIIGMACMFPSAPDVDSFWHNIVSGVDCVIDPPGQSWDPGVFYDPATTGNDRSYCKQGGYLGDLARFNPLEYGIMPVTVDGGEPDQWLALKVAHEALKDAGCLDRPEERANTGVILGKGTYINRGNMTVGYHGLLIEQVLELLRNLHPEYSEQEIQAIKRELKGNLPPFSADTAPALIGNIIAGRIANRFDLMGPSYTVDAACASALIATENGVKALLDHKCDMMLVGGAHVNTPVPVFMLFCQMNALSHKEQIRPFDKEADGTVLGEGLGMVVLKRLEDAQRDGNRIYAVIKGVGTSSDGRAVHVMAPRVEGEVLALERAYRMAGVAPNTVELVEAHGTATPVGDVVEIQALTRVFGQRDGMMPKCALGSVKSMIGHTMPAAGIASIIKTALALYHKTLPPTLHCDEPNPALGLEKTPFYINSTTRPWIHGVADAPRRAGVNAFGFGGVNGHVVLEEYQADEKAPEHSHLLHWESEVFILQGQSRSGLIEQTERVQGYLGRAGSVLLKDLAYTLNGQHHEQGRYRLAIVASSVEDLVGKVARAIKRLSDANCRQIKDNRGIYFFEQPLARDGTLAFIFPGEGAQYPNMLLDICLHFPEVRACFDLADRAFIGHPRGFLPSDYIFPRVTFPEAERDQESRRLWQVEGAVEGMVIGNWAMLTLLTHLGLQPDAIVGHSTGDYSAMFASGVVQISDEAGYIETTRTWNSVHEKLAVDHPVPESALVAVAADSVTVRSIVAPLGEGIHIAMENCPHQTVIAGDQDTVQRAVGIFDGCGIIYEFLPFDRPYHTPIFKPFAEFWCRYFFSKLPIAPPEIELYSCTTADVYPTEPSSIKALFIEHWVKSVRFRETVEKMYADGVRVFVEVGPRGNLTAFVDDILREVPHLAIPSNLQRRSGISQINHLVGLLSAQGVSLNLDYLYRRRRPQRLDLDMPETTAVGGAKGATMTLNLGIPELKVAPRAKLARIPDAEPLAASSASGRVAVAPAGDKPTAANDDRSTDDALARRVVGAVKAVDSGGSVAPMTSSPIVEYFKTMEYFVDAQHEIAQAFLHRGRTAVGAVQSDAAPSEPFPLLGKVVTLVAERNLVALRRLDKKNDIFLREHALGGPVSATDDDLSAICVVPLTVSMEILAEAAAALMPGRILVGMRAIRASRWIQVAEGPITLKTSASKLEGGNDEVEVEVRDLGPGTVNQTSSGVLVIKGVMIFGDRYPNPPPPKHCALTGERRSRLASTALYEGGLMFHGPCFQGVASLERSGKDGLSGLLKVLPRNGLFRSVANPRFVTDPVVLDAAGQMVGFWAAEYLDRGFVVFPYRLDSLQIYRLDVSVGENVPCWVRLELLGTKRMRSDLEIVDADGRVWMRLVGWEDRRFDLPDRFHQFWIDPGKTLMSSPWEEAIAGLSESHSLVCCRSDPVFESGSALWNDLWASLVLSRTERKICSDLSASDDARMEWLSRRTAAKDAVRILARKLDGMDLFPADVDIVEDAHGRYTAKGQWTGRVSNNLMVSVVQAGGVSVAVAGVVGSAGAHLGIAFEPLGSSSRRVEVLEPNERALLASISRADFDGWIVRIDCAKRAIANAIGRGEELQQQSVRISAVDVGSGMVHALTQPDFVAVFPGFAGSEVVVYTARSDNGVLACTLCERVSIE